MEYGILKRYSHKCALHHEIGRVCKNNYKKVNQADQCFFSPDMTVFSSLYANPSASSNYFLWDYNPTEKELSS